MLKTRLLVSMLSVFSLAAILNTPAFAEWQCPVGVDPNGVNNSGVACVWYEEPPPEEEYEYEAPPEPAYSPAIQQSQAVRQALNNFVAETQTILNAQKLAATPSAWNFVQSPANDPNQVCQASFYADNSGVVLIDSPAGEPTTFLGFYGGSIPPVSATEKVRLSLTQSGETQTVQAFHVPSVVNPNQGMYLFAVPSTQALLSSIEDQQDYTIVANGRKVVQGQWQDGDSARHWLSRCVQQRGG